MPPSELVLQVMTVIAFAGTYKVLTATTMDRVELRVLGGAFMVLIWAALAFWWTNYVVIAGLCNCKLERSNTALSLVSAIAGLIVLLDIVKTAHSLISREAGG